MAYELKDGQGSLFRNDKEGNEARPDYRGELNIGGTVYRVAGWIKEGKAGKWMSLKASLPEDKPAQAPAAKQIDPDGDIPF